MLIMIIPLLLATTAAPMTPTTALATGDVRDAWRRPVHTDEVEAWIVSGKPMTSKMMGAPHWSVIEADEGGNYTIPKGGWGLFVFESDQDGPALFDASAFGDAWINGLPRGGDIYGNGNTRLPFLLRKGRNEVLLRSGRGTPSPKVWTAKALAELEGTPGAPRIALLGTSDQTLPDAIEGESFDEWGAVLIYNVNTEPLVGCWLDAEVVGLVTQTPVPTIPPLSFLKVPVQLRAPAAAAGEITMQLRLRDSSGTTLDEDPLSIRVRTPYQWRQNTFRSNIDSSVQYYGFVPPAEVSEGVPGTVLSLHGASVRGGKQASCYRNQPWCMLVAPTNRRPYGFDWEEWGRVDALEAMADAQTRYDNDPSRAWLTGHSMGGHGTWNLGLTLPDRFAAIAPSAGWRSFWTYGDHKRYENDGGVQGMLRRAASPSDTDLLTPNADRFGIYILHGDKDDSVPVTEARAMRKLLGTSHSDFAYYERPGAGHWWGDECMDWPPLMDFLKQRTRGTGGDRSHLTFVTVDPSASSQCDWVTIEQQERSLDLSRVDLNINRVEDSIQVVGTTANVSRLAIDPSHPDIGAERVIEIVLDNQTPLTVAAGGEIHLSKSENNRWVTTDAVDPNTKNPARGGRLRSAWNNNVILVVGTTGTNEETAWNRARARQDAERWWYRGNGLVEIVDDIDFDAQSEPDRGVMLYGRADSNAAWNILFGDSPIQVWQDRVRVGEKTIEGDLAVAFVRPRPGSNVASVATVTGTLGPGERSAATLPFFFSGVGWPDWIVIESASLRSGKEGVVGLGFFGSDWALKRGDSAWRRASTASQAGSVGSHP